MGVELLFMLLPVAALTGWWVGRSGDGKAKGRSLSRDCLHLPEDYFRGLNYLLNEQPDRAIDVFVQMLEVDSETVETHFALANLFRKRGEVERAIRIHQNLIARPTLKKDQRNKALYELGVDYLRAGLYDRAESLFIELVDFPGIAEQALHHLLSIYEREKEWQKAIGCAERLKRLDRKGDYSHLIAHYYCELALETLSASESDALKLLRKALGADRSCIRATLIEAEWALGRGDARQAIKLLRRIEQHSPEQLTEAVPLLTRAYTMAGKEGELLDEVRRVMELCGNNEQLQLAYAKLLHEIEGSRASLDYLTRELTERPTLAATDYLLSMVREQRESDDGLEVLAEVVATFTRQAPHYHCTECGYTSSAHDWHCPSCRAWDTIVPIK